MSALKTGLLLLILITTACSSTAFQTDYEVTDITNNPEFGCSWYGGSSSRIVCNCKEGAEMFIEKNNIPSLRNIILINIGFVIFDEESIVWYGYKDAENQYEERFDLSIPSLRISVYSSTIELISSHSFKGRINEIIFDQVVIEKISPFAFTNLLQTEKITINNSILKVMDQPFKRFSTEYLELNGVQADIIPSRTFSNVTVYKNLVINNCTFNNIRSGAFSINDPETFQFTNNRVGHFNGEAFKVTSRGSVLFRNNMFGAVDDGAFRGYQFQKKRSTQSRKYGSKKQNQNGTLSLIVPDGRTYKETELHVYVEKNGSLNNRLIRGSSQEQRASEFITSHVVFIEVK
ncbi:hypothetical protein NQ317_015366 [Molorchus minor]|uniref:Adhesin-like protein n=1 Tax=Molorchus minor TaxID=1323400 RepID=A0ABQ9JDR1_9CUCU|nr:hypothetical protein NQ317_015366 [Molorchus minor]